MQPRLSVVLVVALMTACASEGPRGSTVEEAPTAQRTADKRPLDAPGTFHVRSDQRISRGRYEKPAEGEDGLAGVVRIEGVSNVTLDLDGVVLSGLPAGEDIDRARGYGIVVKDAENVTIRGGELGGYKGCIVVEGSRGVVIEDVRFDRWFGRRLASTPVAEDGSDWLWPHDNDEGEWLEKYGAAISVTASSEVVIRRCRGRHGQNGILLTRSTDNQVYDNDFSFLSGWGIGMYRASRNVVSHNLFDYCVRGYSHGVYWRGQDSAGILMFERCSENIIAKNSATHGGDGIFLFGGQDTVEGHAFERGELDAGGSDDNVFYENDLSHAVANSLEATFSSRNMAIKNRMVGSHQHGVWGGYSNTMALVDNEIAETLGGGIAIEHGQDCLILRNELRGNEQGVKLWWDLDEQFVNGPFGVHRDTASRDHWLIENTFAENVQDLVLIETTGIVLEGNTFDGENPGLYVNGLRRAGGSEGDDNVRALLTGVGGSVPSGRVDDSTLKEPEGLDSALLQRALAFELAEVPGSLETFASARGERQGLETIVMGEWGPWDYKSGEKRPEPRKIGGVLAGATWDAVWFAWRSQTDPRGDLAAWRALKFQPLTRATVETWVNPWGSDEIRRAVGDTHFGLIARARVMISEDGRYRLTVVSDDGVRLLVDDEVVFEDWTWHAPRRAEQELDLKRGVRTFELEYFQIDGATALTLDLEKR